MGRSRWSLLSANCRFVFTERKKKQKQGKEGKNGRGRLLFCVRCPFNEKSAPGVQTAE